VADWAAASLAARALGVAALQGNELDRAITDLRAAVTFGRRAGVPQLVGEARMSLASALALRGRPRRAFRELGAAMEDLTGVARARARVQRAAILQELGRVDEALEELRRAYPPLRQAGDVQWATRVLSNRGLLLVTKRAFTQAEADLGEARRLYREHDLQMAGAIVEQNLSYLTAQRGDVPAALRHLELAEQAYERLGVESGMLFADRAELLLSVRLVREARAAAEAAIDAYRRQDRQISLPEAHLMLSTVALLDGDTGTALAAADRAAQGLGRVGRRRLLPLVRFARLQALCAADPRSVDPAEARRVAARLRAAGWEVPALEAQIFAATLALERGQAGRARSDLAVASRARRAGAADARARAWLAEAMLRRANRDRRGAFAAVFAGLRVVEEHRATLGATELRAHVSIHRGGLARLGLRMAVEDGRPRSVLSWAERGRATSLLMRPPQPPEDAVLDRDLTDLRATVAEIAEQRVAGQPTAGLEQRQVRLERAIRDHCRQLAGAAGQGMSGPVPIDRIAARLGDAALVEYVEIDGRLGAVTLVAGRAHWHWLGDVQQVVREMTHLPFALHRLANRSTRPASRAAAETVLAETGRVFDALLIRPLLRLLGDRLLLVVPSPTLHSLPWSILPSCAQRPVTVSPSAATWLAAADRPVEGGAGRVVVAAGPGLPGARREVRAVAALHPDAHELTGAVATAAAVSRAMDGAGLVHLAAHGAVRADNPLFSSILLADGPLTVYDLERLRQAPRRVVLAACDTGRPQVVAGSELLGFTAALLGSGTATLVAPVVPVPDVETAPFMEAYHRRLAGGHSPAESLVQAQREIRTDDPVSSAGAAGFVCLGAGLDPV